MDLSWDRPGFTLRELHVDVDLSDDIPSTTSLYIAPSAWGILARRRFMAASKRRWIPVSEIPKLMVIFGIYHLYMGKWITGIIYLLTGGLVALGCFTTCGRSAGVDEIIGGNFEQD